MGAIPPPKLVEEDFGWGLAGKQGMAGMAYKAWHWGWCIAYFRDPIP